MNHIRTTAEFSIYTALAFIFGYIENLIPVPVPFPGIKLGLANLVLVLVLYRKGFRYTFGLAMLRNILNAITFGSLFSLFYSLAGSIFSLLAMTFLKNTGKSRFSVLSVSAFGGIVHNIGQLLAAIILVGFRSIIWYFPVLYFSGLITGILIGMITAQTLKRLPFRQENIQ